MNTLFGVFHEALLLLFQISKTYVRLLNAFSLDLHALVNHFQKSLGNTKGIYQTNVLSFPPAECQTTS